MLEQPFVHTIYGQENLPVSHVSFFLTDSSIPEGLLVGTSFDLKIDTVTINKIQQSLNKQCYKDAAVSWWAAKVF